MTGIAIRADWDDREVMRALSALESAGHRPEVLLKPIGQALVRGTQDRFMDAEDPDGHAWEPLNPVYEAMKQGPGILRESGMRGGLMSSITFEVSGHSVAVGSAKIYAAVHQEGATIRPKISGGLLFLQSWDGKVWGVAEEVTIPARPYLGISASDEREVQEVVTTVLRRVAGW